MLTVHNVLILVAFLCAIGAAAGRIPLWIAVLLLTVAGLLEVIPAR